MTQHVVLASTGAVMGLKPVTYPVRIARIDLVNSSVSLQFVFFYINTGSTLSGGSALDIFPMRGGSPAATALARLGSSSLTFSGTKIILTRTDMPGGGYSTYTGADLSVGTASLQTPTDLTIVPGTVFQIDGLISGFVTATIYFEELRL
jgi:hypothetical protein